MSLKVYSRAATMAARQDNYIHREYLVLSNDAPVEYHRQSVNMANVFGAMYGGLKKLVASSSGTGMLLPLLLIAGGIGFIYMQVQPSLKEEVRTALNLTNQGNVALVSSDYIENRLQYVSNPGADYFRKLTEAAIQSGQFITDTESMAFSGTFYISIPKLGINRMPVQSNVDSTDSNIYNRVLDSKLAHFKGSSLPFVANPGNIVVYGHSVGGSYVPKANDVVSAFTFLPELKVGDEVLVEISGQTHKYVMRRSRVVMPDDVSILASTPGQELLTLFTCYPPGSRDKRLVISAVPVQQI